MFGDLWEGIFVNRVCLSKCAITKIPDGCRSVGKGIVRVRSPFDWIITYQDRSAFIDTKTVQGDVFSHSQITTHQVDELSSHEAAGAISGYVIWLRKINRVFFMPAFALRNALKTRGSFDHTHPDSLPLGDSSFDIRVIFSNRGAAS